MSGELRVVVKAEAESEDNPRFGDLNATPVEDALVEKIPKLEIVEGKKIGKQGKCRSGRVNKVEPEFDGDLPDLHGPISSREEKVSSLKTGLVHVARKMPKNAHAHFILGLMYQRLGQPQKAVSAYEKAEEILEKCEAEIARPDLLNLVQIHHAQCILLENDCDSTSDKELESEQLEEVIVRLKDSVRSDARQAQIWNTFGVLLIKSGRVQSAVAVFSSLLAVAPSNHDCLGNLGVAYIRSGNLDFAAKCFQDLLLRDQNHPAALVNYAAVLLCKYASVVAGAGASSAESFDDQFEAASEAKQCLLAAVKTDPRVAHVWTNLADAYFVTGDHRSASKCLEKAARLEPNCLSTRYSVAMHRIKDAERSLDPSDQLYWAGNEMASIIRDGEHPIAWAGLAAAHKAQHEISSAFTWDKSEIEERALCSLRQAAAEEPDDVARWHQLGVHYLSVRDFRTAQKYLKYAAARRREWCYSWSNLGIALQLSEEEEGAERVYGEALRWATRRQGHVVLSNMGNLYRQQGKYEKAKAMLSKAVEVQPGYAPAFNNLGLVFAAEGHWEEAIYCFRRAFKVDPLLDAAHSNFLKAVSVSNMFDPP